MIWNTFLQIALGMLGTILVAEPKKAIWFYLIITCISQGIDMFRIHYETKKRVQMATPELLRNIQGKTYLFKLAQFYIFKVIVYTLITLASAYITFLILKS